MDGEDVPDVREAGLAEHLQRLEDGPLPPVQIEAGVFKRKALSVHVASFAGLRQWRDQACLAFASPACSSSSSRALRAMPPA